MDTYLTSKSGVESLNCNYLGSRHEKGALNGVGGCLKRIADSVMARGKYIKNFEIFVVEISRKLKF